MSRAPSDRVPAQSLRRIFAMPIVIALAGIAGLILGLTGDGVRDALSWLLLALPLVALLPRPAPTRPDRLPPPIRTKDHIHVL